VQLLQNHKVSFIPGWDCHGLPIELKGKFILQKGICKCSHFPSVTIIYCIDATDICIYETDQVTSNNHKIKLLFYFSAVLKSMDKETLSALTPIKLRQKAAKFAKATVDAQMKSFKVINFLPSKLF
jgi:isoleucyl-tRNA synthetase